MMNYTSMSLGDLTAELEEIEERALDCWTARGMAGLRAERDAVRTEIARRVLAGAVMFHLRKLGHEFPWCDAWVQGALEDGTLWGTDSELGAAYESCVAMVRRAGGRF